MEIDNRLKLTILRYFSIASGETNKYVSLTKKIPENKIPLTNALFINNELEFKDNFLNYIKIFLQPEKEMYSNNEIFMCLNYLKYIGFLLQENEEYTCDMFSFRLSKFGSEFLYKQVLYPNIDPKFEDFFKYIE